MIKLVIFLHEGQAAAIELRKFETKFAKRAFFGILFNSLQSVFARHCGHCIELYFNNA